ncbi:MAG: hypothetical protein WKG07_00750 [Hymenobacter sp.]
MPCTRTPAATPPRRTGGRLDNPNATHFANDANANLLNVNFYESGSFARLKDVSLAYTFPTPILEQLHMTNLKVYVTARNLATVTGYKGLDPELSNQYGIPLQREFLGGLTVGFRFLAASC